MNKSYVKRTNLQTDKGKMTKYDNVYKSFLLPLLIVSVSRQRNARNDYICYCLKEDVM
ncbi:hypothetical protein B4125_1293 [Bacillus paralicheniformis]|nr:hypothetical protein SC10_B2orf02666 [Bacillus paralicheniformis]OLG07112.1 hypothetical protein B4125_1293 [Bacillus paralicheniformis]